MELGSRLSTRLDQRGVRVALVARMGTDLSKHGLRYSHLGIAHRDGDSGWRIVHLLSACETSTSALHEDGLGRFFMDDVVDFEALIIRLPPALEQSVQAMVHSGDAATMHQPRYNVISNPNRLDYQNCNHWVLDVLAGAATGTLDRSSVQQTALYASYAADTIRIPYTKRVVGGLFSKTAVFGDHSLGARVSGKYPVVTVRSVVRFLEESDLLVAQESVRLE